LPDISMRSTVAIYKATEKPPMTKEQQHMERVRNDIDRVKQRQLDKTEKQILEDQFKKIRFDKQKQSAKR
jgi:hypothetical protein